ncbi:MAG: polymer-forming cytoskeletal protein, partial [candidate division Zixibacteria bacterium]|nr:polymer-forming cytoskeletal protein [candidate division Zixibacteria bacterium]
MKNLRIQGLTALCFGLILCLSVRSSASTFQHGDNVNISGLHLIDDDFYAFSDDIRIDGTITGDLSALGTQMTIKGNIGRSANLAGRYVDHNGSVQGSLRFFGDRLTVSGRVGSSLVAFGRLVVLNQGSVVEKDVNIRAATAELEGSVLGNVYFSGGRVTISGQIGGDVALEADKITISPPAVIRGNLTYKTEREDQLKLEPGVTVVGQTTWQAPEQKDEQDSSMLRDCAYRIASLLAAFIFGIIVIGFFRNYAEEAVGQLTKRSTVTIAAGLVGVMAIGLAVVILAMSLLGTFLGNLMLSGEWAFLGVMLLVFSILLIPISSFITVSGAVIFYAGKIVVGLLIGYYLLRTIRPT